MEPKRCGGARHAKKVPALVRAPLVARTAACTGGRRVKVLRGARGSGKGVARWSEEGEAVKNESSTSQTSR